MRNLAQVVAVSFAVIVFLILLPWIWIPTDGIVSQKAKVLWGTSIKPSSDDVTPGIPPENEIPAAQSHVPSLEFEPFLNWEEFQTPFDEIKEKELTKVSISPNYDPFGTGQFSAPPQDFVGSGGNGGGSGSGSNGGSGIAIPVGGILGGGGSANGGGGNGGTPETPEPPVITPPGEPPAVQVPEPGTYLLLATLLTAVVIKQSRNTIKNRIGTR